MVHIPAGKVHIGGNDIDIKSFWIERTETTFDEYDVYAYQLDLTEKQRIDGVDAKSRPSKPYGAPDRGFGHHNYPAISIAFHAADEYCKWLSAKTGKKYRLPTEAEWQYACEANEKQPTTAAEKDKFAWFDDNADDKTHPVAKKAPNAFGLFDML